MTATEQLIAKQVSDVFPASVDDLPLADAARRGLIAPLRCLRVPPAAAINSVPIVGGDFEERALAAALDHQALNQAAASLYRERFGTTPGIVYAAGVDHAYNLAQEFRAAGLKAEAVSGRTPPVKLAETLAAYERGEINVLINAQLLAEGWNSPRATVCMHLAPTASTPRLPAAHRPDHAHAPAQGGGHRRRLRPQGARRTTSASSRSTRCSTPTSTARARASRRLRGAARSGAPAASSRRRRGSSRSRPTSRRRLAVIQREWQRVDPKFLDDDEQRFWATIAGRQIRFDQRTDFARKFTEGRAEQGRARDVPRGVRGREPEPAPADDGARRPRRDAGRARRLRRPRHARHPGAAVGEGPRPRACASCCGRSARARRPRRTRSSPAGRGSSRARRARRRTGGRARSSRRRSACSAPSRTRAATGTRRTSTGSCRSPARCRSRSAPRCSPRPRATRRAPTRSSTRRARSSARSRRSRPRSPRTCRRRSSRPQVAAAAQEASVGPPGSSGRRTPSGSRQRDGEQRPSASRPPSESDSAAGRADAELTRSGRRP